MGTKKNKEDKQEREDKERSGGHYNEGVEYELRGRRGGRIGRGG